MVLKGKKSFFLKRLLSAFQYAFQGIQYAIQFEKNFRIHVVIAVLVLTLAFLLKISTIEWVLIIFAIFGVMSLELVNSAIERAVDLATREIHPLAKQAKDLAAAAVFLFAILAIIIGCIVFAPKLYQLFF